MRKQNWSHETSNNMSQHIVTEQDTKKCESNSNFDTSTSSNSSKTNVTANLSCNKNINSENTETDTQQQQEETQLLNGASTITDAESGIKPLTDIIVNLEDIKPGYINFIYRVILSKHCP